MDRGTGRWIAISLMGAGFACGGRSDLGEPFAATNGGRSGEGEAAVDVSDGAVEEGPFDATGTDDGGSNGSREAGTDTAGGDSAAGQGGGESGTGFSGCGLGGAGLNDCGPSHGDDCCTSLALDAGTFFRNYQVWDGGAIAETAPATVSAVKLDKYDVTVGRFRQFVAAWKAGYAPPAGSGKHAYLNDGGGVTAAVGQFESGWSPTYDAELALTDSNLTCAPSYDVPWTPSPGSQEDAPIACINWWEAYAFCIWDGGFLPTEAEWEYAAAGGSQQRLFPWGSLAPGMSNQYAIYDCNYPSPGSCGMAPVGLTQLGAGAWGQLDLVGNVLEWTLDELGAYADPCVDCANLAQSADRSVRGATLADPLDQLRPTSRLGETPATRLYVLGVRCARQI